MSPRIMVLRAIEQKIEALFEGVFGRAFRTNVQPVELARKLAKEMDDHRTVSVSRVYVPNEYTVYLSAADREQFEGYEDSLHRRARGVPHRAREARELRAADAAEGAARDRRRPRGRRVRHRDADGAAAARQARRPTSRAEQVEPGATMIYKPKAPQPTEAARAEELGVEREVAVLSWDGQTMRVDKRRVVLGRSRECDIQVEDPNVSRRHAELRQEGDGVLDRRPRLDERDRGERAAASSARSSSPATSVHRRLDRRHVLRAERRDDAREHDVRDALLALKIAFLVLLYLFIWRIVRTASRDLRAAAGELHPRARRSRAARLGQAVEPGRLVVVQSAVLDGGRGVRARLARRSRSGAAGRTTSSIEGDEFASARHARFEPRRDGVWVQDLGSTNGTYRERHADRRARASSSRATSCASARPS